MGSRLICRQCKHSDTNRKNSEGKIRCTRFSMWVSEFDDCCNAFFPKTRFGTDDPNKYIITRGRKSGFSWLNI